MFNRTNGRMTAPVLGWASIVLLTVGGSGEARSAADSDLPSEVIALSKISRNVKVELARLSNFVCLETTQRWSKASGKKAFKRIDTVQLEIAHIGQSELYSYPGSRSFDTKHPSDLASFGTTSSGSFAGYLRSVFAEGGTEIRFSGREMLNGLQTLRYEYTCSPLLDRLVLSIAGQRAVASTKGRFWAHAETFQLLRLEAHVASLPPDLPVSDFVTTIDYAKLMLGNVEVWMPQSADMLLSYNSGKQDNNRTVYSHCREYVGESSLSFAEDSTADPSTDPAKTANDTQRFAEVQLPSDLDLPLELGTELNSDQTLVGSPVTAAVYERVVARSGMVIPKGAIVRGRIRVLQRDERPLPHYLVGIEFIELEFDHTRAPFYAQLTDPPHIPSLQLFLVGATSTRSKDNGVFKTEEALWTTARIPVIPGVGLFFMNGDSFRLPMGVRMTWRTERQAKAK